MTVAPAPSKTSAETNRLIDEARDHNKKSEFQLARTKLTRCITLEPNNPLCHRLLGSTYALLKDNKKGVMHYQKFLELAPDDPSAAKVKAIVDSYESTQR